MKIIVNGEGVIVDVILESGDNPKVHAMDKQYLKQCTNKANELIAKFEERHGRPITVEEGSNIVLALLGLKQGGLTYADLVL